MFFTFSLRRAGKRVCETSAASHLVQAGGFYAVIIVCCKLCDPLLHARVVLAATTSVIFCLHPAFFRPALGATVILIVLSLLRIICVFPCHWPSKDGRGMFDVRNDLSACCACEGETGTDKSVKLSTWRNPPQKSSPPPCCVRGSNLGHWIYSLAC